MNEAAKVLTEIGWDVEPRLFAPVRWPPEVKSRYPQLPTEYVQFLEQVRRCVNAAETAWFLTEEDFAGLSNSAFLWNELEAMSLEAAENDDDLTRSITGFWDWHLPIAFSTKSGYSYLALSLTATNYGQIVLGYEPEFEDVEDVCASFCELLPLLKVAAIMGDRTYLSDFI